MIVASDHAFDRMFATAHSDATNLDTLQAIFAILGDLVTIAALVVGGLWAYFKLIKNRTYRPRMDVTITGAWVEVSGVRRLHLTVSLRNIGASEVELVQEGTGLGIDAMQPSTGRHVEWTPGPVVSILQSHAWIEPGETVTEDLVAPVLYDGVPVRIEVRLIWRWAGGRSNIQVVARKIIWPHDVEPDFSSTDRAGGLDRGPRSLQDPDARGS